MAEENDICTRVAVLCARRRAGLVAILTTVRAEEPPAEGFDKLLPRQLTLPPVRVPALYVRTKRTFTSLVISLTHHLSPRSPPIVTGDLVYT